ncbi:DUF4339 domain-containing protein [Shewanella aestuarii]|uniref:DUF4339 domain-containing protein n=1 Tax=Shewanella aestuarii TaxID=1028752 RepID=A0A6G9QNI0_9GAMM|nr:DUF4339 domain-containing protein [Shewanella aestuarii]QIR15381.1 DUF4339 domain-containing protein [Shewanella aestuarii]
MKKWYFSHNGDVTGPLSEVEARNFLQDEPNCYGWHPSFTQWLPVSHISEFAALVPPPESPAQIPLELITDFTQKRKELHATIMNMDESVKYTKTYLYELEQEINIYKRLTNKLSDEVRNNINSIEIKYEGYLKIFDELINAMDIAKSEIGEVTTEFDKRVELRKKDLAAIPKPPAAVVKDTAEAEVNTVKTDNVAEIRPRTASLDPQPYKPSASLDNVAVRVKPGESIDDIAPPAINKADAKAELEDDMRTELEQQLEAVFEKSNAAQTEEATAKAEATPKRQGVTSIFKSVFRGDKKVEPPGELATELTEKKSPPSPVQLAHSNDHLDIDDDDDYDEDEKAIVNESAADRESRIRRRSRRRR